MWWEDQKVSLGRFVVPGEGQSLLHCGIRTVGSAQWHHQARSALGEAWNPALGSSGWVQFIQLSTEQTLLLWFKRSVPLRKRKRSSGVLTHVTPVPDPLRKEDYVRNTRTAKCLTGSQAVRQPPPWGEIRGSVFRAEVPPHKPGLHRNPGTSFRCALSAVHGSRPDCGS